jgi:hypothetical protein
MADIIKETGISFAGCVAAAKGRFTQNRLPDKLFSQGIFLENIW